MKSYITSFLLIFISACSSVEQPKKMSLSEMVELRESRTLNEIKEDTEIILAAHPELQDSEKNKIRSIVNGLVDKQKKLKEEESKVIQVLIQETLKPTPSKTTITKGKKSLRAIYYNKSENISNLIDQISLISSAQDKSSLGNDFQMLFREIRY